MTQTTFLVDFFHSDTEVIVNARELQKLLQAKQKLERENKKLREQLELNEALNANKLKVDLRC